MQPLIDLALTDFSQQQFDHLAFALIDFNRSSCEHFEIGPDETVSFESSYLFDLASVSKPLNLSYLYFQDEDLFTPEMLWALEHQGGLPAWGRLDKAHWRKQISGYSLKKSKTLYSDFGALRLLLEWEKASQKSSKEAVKKIWRKDLTFWKDLAEADLPRCVPTGYRNQKIIQGEVNDDNAFVINDFVSHTGLFASVDSLAQTLIAFNDETDCLQKMSSLFSSKEKTQRFLRGFDTPENLDSTLAGKGCSKETIGHLGFTGTMFWIDLKRMKGFILLTNVTKNFWWERKELGQLRRDMGRIVWNHLI